MNGKKYTAKGFKYCQISKADVYEMSKKRLDFDKAQLHAIVDGLPYSDLDDIRWSGRLAGWLFKAFHLYCKFHRRPQGHKRTDV